MRINAGQLVVRNWPIKLAALFFALMLYVAVAAQQPVTQTLAMHVTIAGPPGRPPHDMPGDVAVLISGRGSEILKLRSLSHVIAKSIPDTFAGSMWRWRLQPSDLPLPKGVDIQVVDITPREIEVSLDSAGKRDVRIVSRVTVEADSGRVIEGLSILPGTAHLVGPAKSVAAVESVTTVPATIAGGNGPFFRTVPIDTSPLGPVRVLPHEVRVSGEATPLLERSFPGVAVTAAASGFAGFRLATERILVQVSGPERRVHVLTRDSLRVVAHLVGHAGPDAYARLTVAAPAGVTAHAVPDSVPLKPPPPPPPPPPAAKRRPPRG
jgi:hypothetical protein